MSEISPIWAPIPPSIFTFYRENPVNPSFSVRVENMLNYRSVYQNTADLHLILSPPKALEPRQISPYFSPSGPHKPCQNTTMRVIFSDDNSIKMADGKEPGNGKIVVSLG
jgi:hypothetical protein